MVIIQRVKMKKSNIILFGIITFTLLSLILISAPTEILQSSNNLGIVKGLGWNIIKQTGDEVNLSVNFLNVKDKKTIITFTLKPNTTIDTSAKTIYGLNNQPILDNQNKPLIIKWEKKCGNEMCYYLSLTDAQAININNYIKLGENSIILEYQNESKINYKFDWGETNITLLRNGIINSNIYVYYNESEGKIDFGANDYSNELKNYTYVLNSTKDLIDISSPIYNITIYENINVTSNESYNLTIEEVYDSPYFYNYNHQGNWNEYRQVYSFEGICDKNYSKCYWSVSLDKKSAILNFKSYGDIDTKSITNITGCVTLSTAGETYVMTADIIDTSIPGYDCLIVSTQNITLDCDGHYLRSTAKKSGVYSTQFNTTIKNCNITMNNTAGGYGIYLYGASKAYVFNNTLNSQYYGLHLYLTTNSTIDSNTINSNKYLGINIRASSINNTIINNIINSNTNYGINIATSSTKNSFINNTINSNALGIYVGTNNNIFTNNNFWNCSGSSSCMNFYSSSSNIVSGGIINLSASNGINLEYTSKNNIFKDIQLTSTVNGINISSGSNNTFDNITANSNDFGIYIGTSNNTLTNIVANSNYYGGIYLSGLNNTLINITTSFGGAYAEGISLFSSSNNLINIITNSNPMDGIYIGESSSNNTFENIEAHLNEGCGVSSSSTIFINNSIVNGNLSGNLYCSIHSDNLGLFNLLNVSYDSSGDDITDSSKLIRKWYYSAYVNDSLGNAVDNANLTFYNVTGTYQFSLLTNSSGYTNQTSIIEYINNAGIKTYYSNYTIKAIDTTGHQLSHSLNITQVQNYQDKFQLSCWSWLNKFLSIYPDCGWVNKGQIIQEMF